MFWYSSLFIYMICKYFLPLCGSNFTSILLFAARKFLILIRSIFSSLSVFLMSYLRQKLPKPQSSKCIPLFSAEELCGFGSYVHGQFWVNLCVQDVDGSLLVFFFLFYLCISLSLFPFRFCTSSFSGTTCWKD